jgi:hypothetical protein
MMTGPLNTVLSAVSDALANHAIEALTEVIELEGGGTLSLLRFHDGTYQLHIDADRLNLRVPLTARDVKRVRESTGSMVLADATEVLRAP